MLDVNATWRYPPPESWRGAAAAVAVLSFDVDAETPLLAAGEHYEGHLSTMSHQVYGPRVGVPRILRMLERRGKPATFFVPGLTAERHPGCMEQILASGHEVALHGHTHSPPCYKTAAEQRAEIERGLAALDRFGVKPIGYRAPFWQTAKDTMEILGEYGIVYDSSMMDDDRPYLLDTPSGRIAELCPQWYLDDWEQYMFVPDPDMGRIINRPSVVAQLWIEELDAERETGSLFMLTCHPFASGRPSRLRAVERLIDFADGCGDVTFARADAVAKDLLAVPDDQLSDERRGDGFQTDQEIGRERGKE
jgi:peptidoglycan/xylan/chitin deacetylase (PgdA/CDA1 family)